MYDAENIKAISYNTSGGRYMLENVFKFILPYGELFMFGDSVHILKEYVEDTP